MILYGKPVADALLDNAASKIDNLAGKTPKLVIITNPNDPASQVYAKNKI